MRRLLCLVLLAAACSGGAKDSGTGPQVTPVAQVVVTSTSSSILVGQTTSATATTMSATGTVLTGRTIAWSSGSPAVATVTSTGVVTAVGGGQAVISATSEGKSGQVTITVTAIATTCAGVSALTLQVGEVHTLTTAERSQLCIAGGLSGGEYVLIPFNSDTTAATQPVSLSATNTIAIQGPLAAQIVANHSGALFHQNRVPDEGLAIRRMLLSRALFSPSLRSRGRSGAMFASQLAPSGRRGINGLATTPTVGTLAQLNANGNDACTVPLIRTARVIAVTAHAIVLADTLAPASGYTNADYQNFAATFDTLVFPLDTSNFGAPSDIDNNGRVVLFFTTAVNQLTPAGSATFAGGFFFNRDLFPSTPTPGFFQCNTSNVGEIFYLPVVDIARTFNEFFDDKPSMIKETVTTLVHEFQHLISASRRIYVNNSDDFETIWLDEGMSHIAEELLYFRIAGFSPKSDLTYPGISANQTLLDAVNFYQIQNLIRLQRFISKPETNSAISTNDSLATRGATWNMLRYLLDQSTGPSSSYTRAINNAIGNGIPSLNAIFASTVPNLTTAMRQIAVALFTDNAGFTASTPYTFPSWNFRSIMLGVPSSFSYSLLTRPLLPGANQTFSLRGGASSYLRFRIAVGAAALVGPPQGGAALATAVDLILVRTQ